MFLAEEALNIITAEDPTNGEECLAGLSDKSDDEFKPVSDFINSTTAETLPSDD